MRVTPEAITVVPEPERGELAVIMAGLRITFSIGEAELLARGLGQALARLGGNSESTSDDHAGDAASALRSAALDPLAGLLKLNTAALASGASMKATEPLNGEPASDRLADSIRSVLKRAG